MTVVDLSFIAITAVVFVLDHLLCTRMVRNSSARDPAGTRRRLWQINLSATWLLTAIGAFIWIYFGRSWSSMALIFPVGWRAWTSVLLVLLIVGWQTRGIARIRLNAASRRDVRDQVKRLGMVGEVVPRKKEELPMFFAVAVTAGICEEFLFRGYLIWALGQWFDWSLAAAISLAAFSLGHAYQGPRGIVQSFFAGAVMTLLVGAFNSLIPAMVVHAAIDIGSGIATWLAFSESTMGDEIVTG